MSSPQSDATIYRPPSILGGGLESAMLATTGIPPMVETPRPLFVGGRGSEEGDGECPGAGPSLAACRQGAFGLLAAWSPPARSGRRWRGLAGRRAGQRTDRERKAAEPAQLPLEATPSGRLLPGALGTTIASRPIQYQTCWGTWLQR